MRVALAVFGAALVLGCKGRTRAADPAPPGGAPAEASGALAGSGGGAGSAGAPTQNVLDLPRSSRSAPLRTTRPLDRARYEKLAGLEYPGWEKDVRYLDDRALEVRYRTKARPILGVTISASPCFDCIPPELPRWKAKEDALKNLLLPELRERKDTLFEIGEVKLAGAPLIYTYQLAHAWGPGEDGSQQGPYSNAYTAYHNDGINQIRVTAQYADDAVATRAELVSLAPREDLAQIALAFLDAYTHAW